MTIDTEINKDFTNKEESLKEIYDKTDCLQRSQGYLHNAINENADYWRYDIGLNVIPADTKSKTTNIQWSAYQLQPLPETLHDNDGTSIYPCKVLNRFACPYDKKMTVVGEEDKDITVDSTTKKLDVNYPFYLSELAFAVELALARAKEEDSVFRIRSSEGAYQVLTNKETLEMVLQQGLKEEHMQYKDSIVELFTNMKDKIIVEDLRVY